MLSPRQHSRKNHSQQVRPVSEHVSSIDSFSVASAMVQNGLPFPYLVWGIQMNKNLDNELQIARKQKELDYKPFHDPTSFKYERTMILQKKKSFYCRIPDEHCAKIEDWLVNDLRKRIDGKITRARCLFMVGPTQHGESIFQCI